MIQSITRVCRCGLRYIPHGDGRMCFFCTEDAARPFPEAIWRRRQREAAWRNANAGRIRRLKRLWRARNRDRLRLYNREYMRRYNRRKRGAQ